MYCTMHEVPRTPCWSQKESVSHSAADESALEVYNQRFVHGIRAQDHQAGGEQAGRRGDKRALMTGGDKWVKLCHSASPDTSGVDGTSCRNPGGWRTFSFCRKNRKQIWYYTVLVNSVVIWGGKKNMKDLLSGMKESEEVTVPSFSRFLTTRSKSYTFCPIFNCPSQTKISQKYFFGREPESDLKF